MSNPEDQRPDATPRYDPFRGPIDRHWQTRKVAVSTAIRQLGRLKKQGVIASPYDIPNKDVLQGLLYALDSFFTAQFDFFMDGFGRGEQGTLRLERSRSLPPDFILNRIINQASFDLTIIRLAVVQRLLGAREELETLSMAEELAGNYLDAVSGTLIAKVDAIAYFHRGASIRRLPYADVALIGIPQTAAKKEAWRDLLAIGHEVGHYVYWNGYDQDEFKGEQISRTIKYLLRRQPLYVQRWREEIFADVFGAIVTGSAAIFYSAADMIWDNAPGQAVIDDGEHPVDVVRLAVYKAVLDFLKDNLLDEDPSAASEGPDSETTYGEVLLGSTELQGAYRYFLSEDASSAVKEIDIDRAQNEVYFAAKSICSLLWKQAQPIFRNWRTHEASLKLLVRSYGSYLVAGSVFAETMLRELRTKLGVAFESQMAGMSAPLSWTEFDANVIVSSPPTDEIVASYIPSFRKLPRRVFTGAMLQLATLEFERIMAYYLWEKDLGAFLESNQTAEEHDENAILDSHSDSTPADSSERWFVRARKFYAGKEASSFTAMPPEAWQVIFFADGWAFGTGSGPETDPGTGMYER